MSLLSGRAGTAGLVLLAALGIGATRPTAEEPGPTFRIGVDVVSVSVSVRDRQGATVPDLARDDFIVLDRGTGRAVEDARLEPDAPIRAALVLDTSGSMGLGRTWAVAREIVDGLLARLADPRNEVALFAFDARLRLVRAFATGTAPMAPLLDAIEPFGGTSLYDSIAAGLEQLGGRGDDRRVLLVVTDGVDTSGGRPPGEEWTDVSAFDVPAYVFVTDPSAGAPGDPGGRGQRLAALSRLAARTGGGVFRVATAARADEAVAQAVGQLRQQYVVVFEASADPGWHPIQIRARDPRLTVRARSGYWVHGPATR